MTSINGQTIDNALTRANSALIAGYSMPDYSKGVTFSPNTPTQAPYDCVVFWNASAATSDPAFFLISPTGAFTTEHFTFPYYDNTDGYETKVFFIPKGWYFKTTRNYENALVWSPSQFFPLKGV